MTTWLGVGISFTEVEEGFEDEDFEGEVDVTRFEVDLVGELVRLDKDFFDMLELETLDEDGDLEVLFALVIDCDLEIVEVDDGLRLVVRLEEEIVLLFDEMDAFEETHLDRPDNDFEVVTVLGEADGCFEVLELNERVDEGNCEQDFVLD